MLRVVLFAALTLPTLPPTVAPTGRISGTIYDNLKVAPGNVPNAGTRQPIHVTAAGEGIRREVSSDTTGLYRLDKLPPGIYRLEFSAPDAYAWTVDDVLVCAKVDTVRDTSSPRMHARVMGVMMRALPGMQSELTVHVATPDGQPIAGAKLTVIRLADHLRWVGSTGNDGSYVFAQVQPGDYSLDISGPGLDARTFPKVTMAPRERRVMNEQVCTPSP